MYRTFFVKTLNGGGGYPYLYNISVLKNSLKFHTVNKA